MRRALLVAAGVVLLAVAVLTRPAPARGSATAALGRSMGGLRVMVVDGLFLRAEAQRKAGRVEDAAALYRSILELDPENEAATAFLAATFVQELMPQIPDLEERFGWWEEARMLLLGALVRRPEAPELNARLANLILDVPLADPALESLIAAKLEYPRLTALRYLAKAARYAETLPRLGRGHLVRIGLLAPDVATRALAAGDAAVLAEAKDIGRAVLLSRGPVLAQIRLEVDSRVHVAQLLRSGLAAVDATAAALAGEGPRAEAVAAIAAYEALLPGTRLADTLRGLLQEGR